MMIQRLIIQKMTTVHQLLAPENGVDEYVHSVEKDNSLGVSNRFKNKREKYWNVKKLPNRIQICW